MKRESETRSQVFSKRKKGMALPLTLIVLLVAGAMVAVSLFLIENMATTTKMKTDDELRLNAAIAGVERGKQWVVGHVLDGKIPRRKDSDGDSLVSSADVSNPKSTQPFGYLISFVESDEGYLTFTEDNVDVKVWIYDLAYEPASDFSFVQNLPPQMRDFWQSDFLNGMSAVQTQSYASSNRGGAAGGGGTLEAEFGAFLIRSRSSLNGIEKVVEQSVVMRK